MTAQGARALRGWLALAASIVIGGSFVAIALQFPTNYGDALVQLSKGR